MRAFCASTRRCVQGVCFAAHTSGAQEKKKQKKKCLPAVHSCPAKKPWDSPPKPLSHPPSQPHQSISSPCLSTAVAVNAFFPPVSLSSAPSGNIAAVELQCFMSVTRKLEPHPPGRSHVVPLNRRSTYILKPSTARGRTLRNMTQKPAYRTSAYC